VTVSAALSTGELLRVPGLTAPERRRLLHLERRLTRAKRGSNRRKQVKLAAARLRARETDRRNAAGHAVTARGGSQLEPVNREPQLLAS
jgi:transposase